MIDFQVTVLPWQDNPSVQVKEEYSEGQKLSSNSAISEINCLVHLPEERYPIVPTPIEDPDDDGQKKRKKKRNHDAVGQEEIIKNWNAQIEHQSTDKEWLDICLPFLHPSITVTKEFSNFIYCCDLCLFTTCYKVNIQSHTRVIHPRPRSYLCAMCPYRASRKRDLEPHIKAVHNQEKGFQCPKCDYRTAYKQHLTSHVEAVHNQSKPYACSRDSCTYRASYSGNLLKHIRTIHEKDRNHPCDKCNYVAAQRVNLTRHIKHVHDKLPRKPPNKKLKEK